jgi:hypothetical protein
MKKLTCWSCSAENRPANTKCWNCGSDLGGGMFGKIAFGIVVIIAIFQWLRG